MGEGDPGRGVPVAFYNAARELPGHGSLLLVDSIQAGLRANGVLSIIDYPGFENAEAPDMETYSKALNAGQYPLSVLAVNKRAGEIYKKGLYGNTMTESARARRRGRGAQAGHAGVAREHPQQGQGSDRQAGEAQVELGGMITKVQGTGLLFSCELSNEFKCFGANSTEEWLREHGIGVIHGGVNSLRFTPTFNITSEEIDLMVAMVARALKEGPRAQQAAAA
jgi:acetylornithine/succinyldiaminopimelate/putrescine aminotransferase